MSFKSFDNLYKKRDYRALIDVSAMGIKCASCGIKIERLSFSPDPNRRRPVYCPKCYQKTVNGL